MCDLMVQVSETALFADRDVPADLDLPTTLDFYCLLLEDTIRANFPRWATVEVLPACSDTGTDIIDYSGFACYAGKQGIRERVVQAQRDIDSGRLGDWYVLTKDAPLTRKILAEIRQGEQNHA